MVFDLYFIIAVIRKMWSTQKKYRILTKILILAILVFFLLLMWRSFTRKEPILLLLAPRAIQLQVTRHCWRLQVSGVAVSGRESGSGGRGGGVDRADAIGRMWERMPDYTPPPTMHVAGIAAALERVGNKAWGVCDSEDSKRPLLAVVVCSTAPEAAHPSAVWRRAAVRKGWASAEVHHLGLPHRGRLSDDPSPHDTHVVFLTGAISARNAHERQILWDEGNLWGDIYTVILPEDVAPETYQHVMALKWQVENCREARYLLVVRDDVYVHLQSVVLMLRKMLPGVGARGLLLCRRVCSGMRTFSGRMTSRKKPCHCDGKVMLYSTDLVQEMYQQVRSLKKFPAKELLLTGRTREAVNASLTELEALVLPGTAGVSELEGVMNTARFHESLSASRVLFSHQPKAPQNLESLWVEVELDGQ